MGQDAGSLCSSQESSNLWTQTLQLPALQSRASEQGREALPRDSLRVNRAHIPVPSRTLILSVCAVSVRRGDNLCIFVPWRPSPLPAHGGEDGATQRGSAGAQQPGSASDTSPRPLLPEQPLQKPKDMMQESKDQTKVLGSFPSSFLHYLARAINFFLS